jgi:hypothetical protein
MCPILIANKGKTKKQSSYNSNPTCPNTELNPCGRSGRSRGYLLAGPPEAHTRKTLLVAELSSCCGPNNLSTHYGMPTAAQSVLHLSSPAARPPAYQFIFIVLKGNERDVGTEHTACHHGLPACLLHWMTQLPRQSLTHLGDTWLVHAIEKS